jgi:hypothetical protein
MEHADSNHVPAHVLARLMRSAAMIDQKTTLPVEAGVVLRLTAEVEEKRREDTAPPDGPFS